MAEISTFILDTFALLAFLQDEPIAAPRIEKLLDAASRGKCRLYFSVINLGELLYITERRGGVARAQDTLALVRQLPIEIIPADEQMVFDAAHIKASHPLSYADAFVAALALRENAVVLTGDLEFHSIETLVTIEWLEAAE